MEDKKDELLQFWFGDDPDDAAVAKAKAELWWGHRRETDELLQARFGAAASAAAADVLDHWVGSPRGRLAVIIRRAVNRRHAAYSVTGLPRSSARHHLARV